MSISMFIWIVIGLFVVRCGWKSLRVVPPNMAGIVLFFGKPITHSYDGSTDPAAHQPGKVWVPWVPFKWSGFRPWELLLVPTKMFQLSYEISADNKVFSADHQLMHPQATLYLRFPYKESEAMAKIIAAGVPLTEEKLTIWAEDIIIPALRQAMAVHKCDDILTRTKLGEINDQVRKILHDKDGVFNRVGLLGRKPDEEDPGTGEVNLLVEEILPTQEMQDAMAAPLIAKKRAEAAASVSDQKAIEVGGPMDRMMHKWVKAEAKRLGKSIAETVELTKQDGTYQKAAQTYKDLLLADGGNLNVGRFEIGSPDNGPLPSNLTYLSVGGGGGAGVLIGGKSGRGGGQRNQRGGGQGQGGGGQSGGGGGKFSSLADDELDEEFDDAIRKIKGK